MSDSKRCRQPEHKVPDLVSSDLRQRFKGFDAPEEDGFNPSAQPQTSFGLRIAAEAGCRGAAAVAPPVGHGFGKAIDASAIRVRASLEAVEDTGYRLFNREADEMAFAGDPFRDQLQLVRRLYHGEPGPAVHAGMGILDGSANLKILPPSRDRPVSIMSAPTGSAWTDSVCTWIRRLPQIGTVIDVLANTTTDSPVLDAVVGSRQRQHRPCPSDLRSIRAMRCWLF